MRNAINSSRQPAGNRHPFYGKTFTEQTPPSLAIPGRCPASDDAKLEVLETFWITCNKKSAGIICNRIQLCRITRAAGQNQMVMRLLKPVLRVIQRFLRDG